VCSLYLKYDEAVGVCRTVNVGNVLGIVPTKCPKFVDSNANNRLQGKMLKMRQGFKEVPSHQVRVGGTA
jgi:hypothetical protein